MYGGPLDPSKLPGPDQMYPPEDPERPVRWWHEPILWFFIAFGLAAVVLAVIELAG